MQLFRAQLSHFNPHPHRDSWMRNNLVTWLDFLRWAVFLTLIGASWLNFAHHSPIGNLILLDKKIQDATLLPDHIIQWGKIAVSLFLAVSGFLAFRCGKRYRAKYTWPVLLSGCILVLTALWHWAETQFSVVALVPFILPASTPFLLIRYRLWNNMVDHWNYLVCALISLTMIGFSLYYLLNLKSPSSTGLMSYPSLILSQFGLNPAQQSTIILSVSYIALAATFGLFIVRLRRLALYIIIALAILSILSCAIVQRDSLSIAYRIAEILFYSSFWALPTLNLLSLASSKKASTLRL